MPNKPRQPRKKRPEPETMEQAVERMVAGAEAQGLPRYVEDPATLDLIARIVIASRERRRRIAEGGDK